MATSPIFLSDQPIEVMTGRTLTLSLGSAVSSVRVLEGPAYGNVTANPDGTLAVVMSDTDYTGPASFRYEVSYADGRVETAEAELNLMPGAQQAGWGMGDFMLLETDANDRTVVEYGDNHRVVHVSGSETALSRADIAAREGLDVAEITADWLRAHPEYGASPELALDQDAGLLLWNAISGRGTAPNSNWLLFEKGYEYDIVPPAGPTFNLIGARGESALHPMLISSYGEAGEAVLNGKLKAWNGTANIVMQDINLTGNATFLQGDNLLFEDFNTISAGLNFQNLNGVTLRNSTSLDAYREQSTIPGDGIWNAHQDRTSAIYVSGSEGVLLENNTFDHAGWGEGYDYNLSEDAPQPPSIYSHNVYIQHDNTDVTFRDNITMRGASFGAQVRSGGFIEDNVFLDNNAAVNFLGGDYNEAGPVGNYTLFADNLITSAGHKRVAAHEGALSIGVSYSDALPVLLDNIIAHLADPGSPDEQAEKTVTHNAVSGDTAYYDDTIIYNWNSKRNIEQGKITNPDTNIDGLDQTVLDQTTIQNFAAELLNQSNATIDDLAEYLRAQANGQLDHIVTADLIIAFFQKGFGLTPEIDPGASAQRFIPNDLGDGMRWDNRLNWDQGYVPASGQDVEFGGNWVYYAGAGTNEIRDFDLGTGGRLMIDAGRLTVTGEVAAGEKGGQVGIGNAGQFWMDGYADADLLTVDISGGRFANTGTVSGQIGMNISGGQTLLATGGGQFDLTRGSTLTITGSTGKIGFDGPQGQVNTWRLDEGAGLNIIADQTGIASIGEFRSGAYGETPGDPLSGIRLGGILTLDLTAMPDANDLTLISADEIIGSFSEFTVKGLKASQDAILTTDYDSDTVTLSIADGTGQATQKTTGQIKNQTEEKYKIWDALTGMDGGTEVKTYTGDNGEKLTLFYTDGVLMKKEIVDAPDVRTWQDKEYTYNSNGDLARTVTNNDDGRVFTKWYQDGTLSKSQILDTENVTSWQSLTSTYASNGDKMALQAIYDDMVVSNTTYTDGVRSLRVTQDTEDMKPTKQVIEEYDVSGSLSKKEVLYDSGRLVVENYNSNGDLARTVTNNDDGRVFTKWYQDGTLSKSQILDAENVTPWQSLTSTYASNGDKMALQAIYDDMVVSDTTYTDGVRSLRVTQDTEDMKPTKQVIEEYDASGSLSKKEVLYDSGRLVVENYNSNGDLARKVTNNDDGRVFTKWYQDGTLSKSQILDAENVTSWQSLTSTYASNGDKMALQAIYDDMVVSNTTYTDGVRSLRVTQDTEDMKPTKQVIEEYDASGSLSKKEVLYDSGRLVAENYIDGELALYAELDQQDEFIWQAKAKSYDPDGQLIEYTQLNDNGSIYSKQYDTDYDGVVLGLDDVFLFEEGKYVADTDDILTAGA